VHQAPGGDRSRPGPAAEQATQEKRADYFACGIVVVWDVDLLSEEIIKSYKASDPENPVIFRRGETADAEPAVPGWRTAPAEGKLPQTRRLASGGYSTRISAAALTIIPNIIGDCDSGRRALPEVKTDKATLEGEIQVENGIGGERGL
jgi:hypothetical protein